MARNLKHKAKRPLARTRKILCVLADVAGDYMDIWYDARDFRSALMRGGLEYVKILKRELERKAYRQSLYQLRRKKYIQVRGCGESLQIRLTDAGRLASYADRIRLAKPLRHGEMCLVSFDIPETHRAIRSRFRRFLRVSGFKMRQRSFWTTDRDVVGPLAEAVKRMRIGEWVLIHVGSPATN